MNISQKIKPEWPLRLGLGLMYLYSAYDIFYHPSAWTWAIPSWFRNVVEVVMPLEAYLRIQAVGEFAIALLFVAWFSGKWGVRIASILATLEMAGILLLTGIDSITFRDIGLLGAALALVVISFQNNGTAKQT